MQKHTKYCKLCNRDGHYTNDCPRFAENTCTFCHKFGHRENNCWYKYKDKMPDFIKNKRGNPFKRPRHEEAHEGDIGNGERDEEIACHADTSVTHAPTVDEPSI